jgi:hypothetical protein
MVCTYPASSDLVWVDGKASSTTEEPKSSTKSPPPYSAVYQDGGSAPVDDPSLNLENIDLIIHWFTSTVHTVNPVSDPAAVNICQTLILKQAMQHHFLLHGLLALSALHLANSSSDPQKYTSVAIAHHTRGLALYHSVLADIDEKNYSASIAFSSITIMFEFGLSKPDLSREAGSDLIDILVQMFLLVKGWHHVVRVANALESRSGSSILPQTKSNVAITADVEEAFCRLQALNQGTDTALYTDAISSLKSVFGTLAKKGDNPHVALEWLNTLPEGFIRLIKARQSFALIVLGHYCVVLHKSPQVWWLKGWSVGLLRAILRGIDPIHRDSLGWAKLQVGVDA